MSREPLDASERALAETLARLPAIEPPPALDSRVLTHARDALKPATKPRSRHPWWMGAGLGTAAAAVLAAGVAWQTGLFDIRTGSDVAVPRMPARGAAPDAAESVAIDLRHAPASHSQASAPTAEAPAAAPPSLPPAAPPPVATDTRQALPESRKQAYRAIAPRPEATPDQSETLATTAPSRDSIASEPITPSLDSITVSGTRAVPDESYLLPHWREDAKLAPEEWLERIRERVRRGERHAAASSLRLFTQQHPSRVVPDDLMLLLVR